MRITYDPRADALAIELRDVPVARTCEVTDTINVDLGKDGRAVVVEILNVRKGLGDEVLQQVGLDLGGIQWQPEQDTIYATDEAARLVGVSRQYLSKMAREKKIPARRSGRDWLFYRSGLVEFFGPQRVGKVGSPSRRGEGRTTVGTAEWEKRVLAPSGAKERVARYRVKVGPGQLVEQPVRASARGSVRAPRSRTFRRSAE
jgi:excisionase family DNA binding protein